MGRGPARGLTDRDTPRRGGKMRDGFEPGDFNNDRATNPKFAPKPVAIARNPFHALGNAVPSGGRGSFAVPGSMMKV